MYVFNEYENLNIKTKAHFIVLFKHRYHKVRAIDNSCT